MLNQLVKTSDLRRLAIASRQVLEATLTGASRLARGTVRHWRRFASADRERGASRSRSLFWVSVVLAASCIEAQTGTVQSVVLSSFSSGLNYRIEPARSPRIAFPGSGPLDSQRGYNRIPAYTTALGSKGYTIREQSHFSPGLLFLSRLGIPFPFRDKPVAGLVIRGARGDTLYNATVRHQIFRTYGEIPPLVERSLLFIENRGLQESLSPTQNPAIDWGRLVKASLLWTARHIGLPVRLEGGSTLAVQLMKYRHSTEGRTHSPFDKLRQITAASLAAYRTGPVTEDERHEVVLDYLNTIPLAATPVNGEVSGINDGLRVWFGLDPSDVWSTLANPSSIQEKAAAYKRVLSLLCAAQAPSRYLRQDHAALERRVDAFTRLFVEDGVIDVELALATLEAPLAFAPMRSAPPVPMAAAKKAAYVIRRDLSALLGEQNFYDLARLDLRVETTLDDSLQARALRLFNALEDTGFVAAHGLAGEHLLSSGDPRRVSYSLLLFEIAPGGDRACAHVDNFDAMFDMNTSMKLELGSTAKLRTLAHYLQVIDTLHHELAPLGADGLERVVRAARDPLTRWAAANLAVEPAISVDTLLERALDRPYSANPGEAFYTGGGVHAFSNFNRDDDGRKFTVREALVRSNNLVFIRLMRDLVRYYGTRLPYDPHAVMEDLGNPDRRRLLEVAAEDEARLILWRSHRRTAGLDPAKIDQWYLGADATPRSAATWYYVRDPHVAPDSVASWLGLRFPFIAPGQLHRMAKTYGNPNFTLLDHAYVLGQHPLDLWAVRERWRSPEASWDSLWARSAEVREICSAWLFEPGHLRAQNLRLRTQIEREIFARMTPTWRSLGFPFKRLVPSYATAVGASGDRPVALARLMGIILGDGAGRSSLHIEKLVFGAGTPYHTAFEPTPQLEENLLSPSVARALRGALAEVVERGTARRVSGVFALPDSTAIAIGGKTGSGDNRYDSYARGGRFIGSRSTSRTATFAFYLGERHYGVITATVLGARADQYRFTSALPLSVLKLLAPAIEDHLRQTEPQYLAAAAHNRGTRPGSETAAVQLAPATPSRTLR